MATGNSAVSSAVSEKAATWTIPLRIRIAIGGASATNGVSAAGIQVSAEARTLKESSLEAQDSGAIESTVLERPGFDLDTAVFLAEASSAAYANPDEIDEWAHTAGFEMSKSFDSGNVQGSAFQSIRQKFRLNLIRRIAARAASQQRRKDNILTDVKTARSSWTQ